VRHCTVRVYFPPHLAIDRDSIWKSRLSSMMNAGRPRVGETEEELLAAQQAFLESGARPGATVVQSGTLHGEANVWVEV
jgi:hypothetical protein